jgi:penicillin-binding protein 1B
VQDAAETALTRGLANLEQNLPELARPDPAASLQGAVAVMKPQTGAILAMVGGRDYRFSQYNRISQARRQAGSTFKIFTYLAGLDRFSPVAPLANVAKTYLVDGKPWEPRNYGGEEAPVVSLQEGLARSINRATVDLAMTVGLEAVVRTARDFGFSTDIQPFPSLALGAVEVYPLELARAYCALAASGVEPYPLSLREVNDDQGRLLEQRHVQVHEATTPAKAFLITSMLQSAVTHGTARGLLNRGVSIPVAGKTGTTNDFRDAWFIGYTPDILILVWVGFDNGDTLHLAGSQAALPICADILRNIPHQLSGADFSPPQGAVQAPVCQRDGFPELDGGCDNVADMWFLADNVPEDAPPLANARAPWYRWFKNLREKRDAP